MRNVPLKGLMKKSPIKKDYNFKKGNDYKTAKPDSVGGKIASAVTPKKMLDLVPMGKAVKAGKAIYNYFSS